MKLVANPLFYLIVFTILIITCVFLFPGLNIIHFQLAGLPFLILGIYMIFNAYFSFKDNDTSVKFGKSYRLVKEGLYKYSRNPMYLGMIAILVGISLLSGNILSFVFPILFFLIMQYMFIPYEEEKLEAVFGKLYIDYKKEVRRWI